MAKQNYKTRVVAYRLDGTLFRVYDTARQAALNRHAHLRTIDKCIRGDTLTAFGYMWRRYQVDRIPEKIEPFEPTISNVGNIPVAEVDFEGKIIEVYPSIKLAGKMNKTDPHSIRDVLFGKCKLANGNRYRKLTENEIEKYGFKLGKSYRVGTIKVIQLSLDGKYIKTHKSIMTASRTTGIKHQGIQNCLKGRQKTAGGFKWRKA